MTKSVETAICAIVLFVAGMGAMYGGMGVWKIEHPEPPPRNCPEYTAALANRQVGQVIGQYRSTECWIFYPNGKPVMGTDLVSDATGIELRAICK